MEDSDLRDALENTGLTQYQAEAYLALLDLGSAPAADIAEKSGVPGPRIYDVLRDLEDNGYVELFEQGRLHARVHDPSSVIETFETRREQFERAMATVQDRWERPDIDNYAVSIVKRTETALERTEEAIRQADNQIKLCVSDDGFHRFLPHLRAAISRGVHVKICLSRDSDADASGDVHELEGPYTEVRRRALPAPFLAIVDRDTVCFGPHQQSTNEYGVIVNDPSQAYVFNVFFLTSLWTQWTPILEPSFEEPTREYVDIRRCVHDVDALMQEDATIYASVQGTEVRTGSDVEFDGKIVETGYDMGPDGHEDVMYPLLDGLASLTIETEDGTYTVGGWGATLEDVEARRISIDRIEPAPPS